MVPVAYTNNFILKCNVEMFSFINYSWEKEQFFQLLTCNLNLDFKFISFFVDAQPTDVLKLMSIKSKCYNSQSASNNNNSSIP